MTDADITESLQGQIEGLAQSFLVLGATLQHKGLVDAQLLQANLRRRMVDLPEGGLGQAATRRLMTRLAEELQHVFLHGRGGAQSRERQE
ncbi:MAG: hypothetical protein ABI606_01740 [Rhodoferax sp.]